MGNENSAMVFSPATSASQTLVASAGAEVGGVVVAGTQTLTLSDGNGNALANITGSVSFDTPVAFQAGLFATGSGSGMYSVLYRRKAG